VQGQRLYRALSDEGFDFTVLTARHGQAAGRPRVETRDGVLVRRLAIPPAWVSAGARAGAGWRLIREIVFSLACCRRILSARDRIDLLHIHAAFLPPLVLLARLLGIPVIVKQTMAEPPGRGIGGRLQRWALRRADRLVVMSQTMLRGLSELGTDRVKIIPQGVDTELFRPPSRELKLELRQALGLDPQAQLIAFVGAIQPRKGVDLLVRAFVEAAARVPRLGLVLIGQHDFTGHPIEHLAATLRDYRASLQETLTAHDLADRVHWVGKLPSRDVARYLQAADIVCLPSRLEGTPSAPLEAMACGLPVVVSALDGTSAELLTHGREGYIVADEDPARYAEHFGTLASDPGTAQRMGSLGRERVDSVFSFGRAVRDYRALFAALGGSVPGAGPC